MDRFKMCGYCRDIKPYTAFNASKTSKAKHKLQGYCIECTIKFDNFRSMGEPVCLTPAQRCAREAYLKEREDKLLRKSEKVKLARLIIDDVMYSDPAEEQRRAQRKVYNDRARQSRRSLDLSLRNNYGINIDDYVAMYVEQKGACAICGVTDAPDEDYETRARRMKGIGKDDIVVDHDHVTKEIRGLIHRKCNAAIGLIGDNPSVLRGAAAYILKHREVV